MVPLMLTVLPPCVKLFIFRLQAKSLHLAQVNHAIQQGINVSGYNSPFAKLSKNATFFFCKVDCCNILSKYAIRTRRNLHIDQNTPKKKKKIKLCSYILLLKLIIWKGGKYVSYDGIDQKNLNEGESGSFSCS